MYSTFECASGAAQFRVDRPATAVAHCDGHRELEVPVAREPTDRRRVGAEVPAHELSVEEVPSEAGGHEAASCTQQRRLRRVRVRAAVDLHMQSRPQVYDFSPVQNMNSSPV